MKASCIPRGLALATALALSSAGAFAASGELRALSESEMSTVYGRGLSEPTLTALGALTAQEQSGSYASSSQADALASMALLSSDSTQSLDRQLSQQQAQTATVGVQATIKMAQTLAAVAQFGAPVATVLPMMPFPLLFTLPALPSLAAINGKH